MAFSDITCCSDVILFGGVVQAAVQYMVLKSKSQRVGLRAEATRKHALLHLTFSGGGAAAEAQETVFFTFIFSVWHSVTG